MLYNDLALPINQLPSIYFSLFSYILRYFSVIVASELRLSGERRNEVASLSIIKRKRKGATVFVAEVKVTQGGRTVHSESLTFSRYALAKEWGDHRKLEVQSPNFIKMHRHSRVTLGELIQRYIDEYGQIARFGRSKLASLKYLLKTDLAKHYAMRLTSNILIEHARFRRVAGAGPSTINNDLIWARIVLATARAAWKLPVEMAEVEDAFVFCRAHGIIGKAKKRNRRPTPAELDKLSGYFMARDKRSDIPMYDIMWFAIYSARRQEEITRLRWADNDQSDQTGMVRDLKHPRKKEGNDKRFKYTNEARVIVGRQPKPEDAVFIFPYNPRSISAYFTDACKLLEIVDLHFHDLRHEATSRLFEQGYSIQNVQQFTLHESWEDLKRYTHLRPGSVKIVA